MDFLFQNELEIVDRTREILKKKGASTEELKKEYRFLVQQYEKLLKGLMKITRVGDMNYKKLMNANDQVLKQTGELEALNRELRDANAAKDKLYSIIAHDLRNPLQFLLFSSDFINSEWDNRKPGEESVRKYIEKVFNTAQNMSELLENLLEWARSQYGEMECRPAAIDLYLLVKETVRYFAENAEKKHISIKSSVQAKTMVYADENMIQSVLRNMVSNAVKFTGPGGTVTISTRKENGFFITSVRDSGVGIAREKLDLLFKIGEDTITTGTAHEKGTGLGLILCKEFVEKNKGRIIVTSEKGKGSLFEFALPEAL